MTIWKPAPLNCRTIMPNKLKPNTQDIIKQVKWQAAVVKPGF